MKRASISPAQVDFEPDGTPRSPVYADLYHPRDGAWARARAVFLAGNDLPKRWHGRRRFVILETGFGLGHNFLATWQAWAEDPQACGQLWFVSIERHPVPLEAAKRALSAYAGTALDDKARALLEVWPAASPDGFRAHFAADRVVLQVLHGDVGQVLRDWPVQADALYLDGFSPRHNPEMWSPSVFKALARRVGPGCTAASWSADQAVSDGLVQAGFEISREPGFAQERWRLRAHLTRPAAAAAVGRDRAADQAPWQPGSPPVVVIGAGLAGAACALGLSMAGVPTLVLDRAAQPAQGASGNPAGLFHGVLHPEDGAHARLGRAAAWMAQRHYGPLIEAGQLAGQAQGLLRLLEDTCPGELQALIDALGLPPEYAQACSAEQVAALLAMPSVNPQSACRFMGGGWIDPGAWVRWALGRASVQFQGGAAVHALQRTGADWTVLGAGGQVLARTRHVVLCAAADLLALLPSRLTAHWPVAPQRGQITQLPASQTPGPGPLRPVSGHGYALTLPNGDVLCGATSSEQDACGDLRPEDHLYNLQRMNRLLGWCAAPAPASLGGRVGWRFQATDRLPIVGPVEAFTDAARSSGATRLRELPAEPGLFAATALGSRGITWAPLVGAVIAHWIAGEPPPLPTSLLQAIDPRRFALRRSRKSNGPA